MDNPYVAFVDGYARLLRGGKDLPLGGISASARPLRRPDAPKALLFSPHPDDECITGALPLRLLREAGMRVVNVAVTQGSNKDRQQARWNELSEACAYLGFECRATCPGGLEKISPKGRDADPANWAAAVRIVAGILGEESPRVVVMPHERDWNGTHIGTHRLVLDAFRTLAPSFECVVIETEFWAAMDTPNLMVESTPAEVAELVAAISFHVGEVKRNPYHLTLPAWMQDNVRRGGEIVGGQGGAAPDYAFATLYRLRRWCGDGWQAVLERGMFVGQDGLPGLLRAAGL